jgi:ribose transport system permease protein
MGQIYGCLFVNGSDPNTLGALIVIVLIGALFGTLNGIGISLLHISPLVMTLATSSLVNGVVLISINGAPNGVASPVLERIGAGAFGFLPSIVWVWILLTAVTLLFLNRTVIGRKIYHLGMSPAAAKYSGIKVSKLQTMVYVMSGSLSALTGFFLAGNTSRAFLESGNVYTMWSITAVVIGGTSMTGGKGGYLGTAAGAVIIIMLEGILTVIKIPEAGRKIASGLILLMMILLYYRKKRIGN